MFLGEPRMRAYMCVCVSEKERGMLQTKYKKKQIKYLPFTTLLGFFFNLPFLIGGPVEKIIKRHVVTVSLNGQ